MVEITKNGWSVWHEQTIRLLLTDHLFHLNRWSVFLFYNLCILNMVHRLCRSIRCLWAAARKLKPVQQFRSRIDQTTNTDNDKCRGTYSHRIEQRNQTGNQNQYRHRVKAIRHRHPATGGGELGNLLHSSHQQNKSQYKC